MIHTDKCKCDNVADVCCVFKTETESVRSRPLLAEAPARFHLSYIPKSYIIGITSIIATPPSQATILVHNHNVHANQFSHMRPILTNHVYYMHTCINNHFHHKFQHMQHQKSLSHKSSATSQRKSPAADHTQTGRCTVTHVYYALCSKQNKSLWSHSNPCTIYVAKQNHTQSVTNAADFPRHVHPGPPLQLWATTLTHPRARKKSSEGPS